MKSIIIKINWCKFKEKEAEELLFHKNKYKSTVEKKEKKKTPAWKTTNVSWVEIQCVKVIFRALAYIRSHRHIKMSIFTLSWVTRWNLSIEKDLLCLHDAQVKRAANPTGAILMRKFSHFYSTRLNVKNKKKVHAIFYTTHIIAGNTWCTHEFLTTISISPFVFNGCLWTTLWVSYSHSMNTELRHIC